MARSRGRIVARLEATMATPGSIRVHTMTSVAESNKVGKFIFFLLHVPVFERPQLTEQVCGILNFVQKSKPNESRNAGTTPR